MKVFLIDPIAGKVTEHDIPRSGSGFLECSYELLQCSCVTIAQYDEKNVVYCDDEGLLKEREGFFMTPAHPDLICGRALVVGDCDDDGENTETSLTLEDVQKGVSMVKADHLYQILASLR